MLRKNVALLFLFFSGLCAGQNVKYKMIYMQSPAVGRYMLHILPWGYDSAVTAEQIARCIDTMQGHLFNAKMYNLLYKDDSAKLAVKAEEGTYFFHTKYTITLYWKNGDKKSIILLNKHCVKYHEFSYYENDAPRACGKYKKGHKVHRWVYFNTQGLKVKVERYAQDGSVKKTRTFNPPKKCWKTTFNPRHPGGTPYIIDYPVAKTKNTKHRR